MYQLILLTSKLKYEYYVYFINSTNYFDWLLNDVKDNLIINNNSSNNNNNISNGGNTNNENNNYIDYITIENVIYNSINIIEITLRYENYILNDNNNNNKILFIKNLYIKILSIVNSLQDIIFNNNNNNFSLLNKKNNNDILNNINNYSNNFALKSKYLCLLGLLNYLNINQYININNINNNNNNNENIQEFDNRKFILQIYNDEFKTKYIELTLPFCFYLKSLIINNKNILSIITELEIVNNFFIFYSSNQSNNYCTLSSFFDFCELILSYSDPKILINSNIINELLLIINKIIFDNSNNNNKLIDDIEVKNKLIEFISKMTDLNDICINEKIINIPKIFDIIINFMMNNFYYIEDMNYLNKKGIVFNILLIENGLNLINNILSTNSNSFQKILEHFTMQNLAVLTNLFDKIYLLWDTEDKSNQEIMKNKYVFDKYKEIPKKNILIQILLIFDNLSEYKTKFQYSNNNYDQIFNYINEISINMRLNLRELKINSEGMQNYPILVLYTQCEEEIKEKIQSEFTMEIDGLSFNTFQNSIKEGYQSDLEMSYLVTSNNNTITRYIKTEKDFEVFIQELIDSYESQPNKDNRIEANLLIKLKEKKPKVKRNCINCQKEIEVELDIDEKKLEEMNNLSDIENINKFNKLINESNQLCKDCEKLILEHAKNQINIENSKNKINNLSGINISNLNISNIPVNHNNTYQNILANDNFRNNILNNNTSILSTSLFNRTFNSGIGLNNINNQNNNNLFGINNNISSINPTTPRRENSIFSNNLINNSNINNNNIFSSSMANYKVHRTNVYP